MLRLPVIDQLLVVYQSGPRDAAGDAGAILFLSLPTMGINLDKNVAAIVALTLTRRRLTLRSGAMPSAPFRANSGRRRSRWGCAAGPTSATSCCRRCGSSLPALVNEMSF